MQASRILFEKFTSENKESVITLNQHRCSRVSIIFILNYGLVALCDYSSDIISSDFRNNFLMLPHSGKCLRIFTSVFAENMFPLSNLWSL